MNKNKEKGFALILSIVLLIVMSLMGGSLIVVSSGDHQSNNNSDQYQQTFYVAETGLMEGEKWILDNYLGHWMTSIPSDNDVLGEMPSEPGPLAAYNVRKEIWDDKKTEYELSPIEQAGKFKDHGFKNLHIVDLDGALTGETVNLDIIQDIVGKFNLKVEVGGGIRNSDSIQKYIDAGVEKVILGSAAIKDKNFLKESCENFQNHIALGLDAKDGYLSVSGWKESSNKLTLDYLKEINDYGVSRLIYTDINRDGMKQSPNFNETMKVAEMSKCPVIISGGVSSIDDIKKAKNLENVEGIIVGKAIYDGDIQLEELVKEDA